MPFAVGLDPEQLLGLRVGEPELDRLLVRRRRDFRGRGAGGSTKHEQVAQDHTRDVVILGVLLAFDLVVPVSDDVDVIAVLERPRDQLV